MRVCENKTVKQLKKCERNQANMFRKQETTSSSQVSINKNNKLQNHKTESSGEIRRGKEIEDPPGAGKGFCSSVYHHIRASF